MSWAQLCRVKRKSRAGRKLGESLAPGPSTLSCLCAPLHLCPGHARPQRGTANSPRLGTTSPGAVAAPGASALLLLTTSSTLSLGWANPPIADPPPPPRVCLERESSGTAQEVRAVHPPPRGRGARAAGAAENLQLWPTLRGSSASRSEGRGWSQGRAGLVFLRSPPPHTHTVPAGRGAWAFLSAAGLPEVGGAQRGWGVSRAPCAGPTPARSTLACLAQALSQLGRNIVRVANKRPKVVNVKSFSSESCAVEHKNPRTG